MKPPITAFALRARLAPAIIATAPGLVLMASFITWTQFHISQLIAPFILAALITPLADFARRHGLKVQPEIFAGMGGKPSTAILRHRDTRIHADTKTRIVGFLAQRLGEAPPTPAAEHGDADRAEAFYERCDTWLRENTRDTKTFDILFEELISYNFHRNLYGLKAIAFKLSALAVAVAAIIATYLQFTTGGSHDGSPFFAVLIVAVLQGAYFYFSVTRPNVEQAATKYAKQLLASTDRLIASPPAITRAAPRRQRAPRNQAAEVEPPAAPG